MMRPFCRMEIRSPSRSASSRSWLTNRMVLLTRACSVSSSSCSLPRISGSSAENGSSMSRMSASVANARASPTRCCMPPDSSLTKRSAHCDRPTSSSFSSTIVLRFAAPRRAIPGRSRRSRAPCAMAAIRTVGTPWPRARAAGGAFAACRRWRRRWRTRRRESTPPRVTGFKPLAARRRVDLPEPERPMSTEISPRATLKLAPATPTMTPYLFWMSLRVAPPSERGQRVAQALASVAPGIGKQDIDVLEFHAPSSSESPRSFGRLMRSRMMASSTMVNPPQNPCPPAPSSAPAPPERRGRRRRPGPQSPPWTDST